MVACTDVSSVITGSAGHGVVDEFEGVFWHPDTPHRKVRGKLISVRSQTPELRLLAPVVDVPGITYEITEHGGSMTDSRTVRQDVAAFRPMTLHGELEDGSALTALYAQGGSDPSQHLIGQSYRCRFVLVGAHLDGPRQLYTNTRFQMGGIYSYVSDGPASAGQGSDSCLNLESDDDGLWLRYQHRHPVVLAQLVNAGVAGCLSLSALATCVEPTVVRTQVLLDGSGVWLDVISKRLREARSWKASQLLPWSEVTVARLARWIPIAESFDGLEWAVIAPPSAAVQVQLLTAASAVEGLHRRICDRRELSLTNGARRRVIRAAKNAGRDQCEREGVEDLEAARKMLGEAIGHFDELTFAQRAHEFVSLAQKMLPELFTSLPDFAPRLVAARNQLAHHFPPPAEEAPELRLLRWAAISRTVPWVLRIVLLDKAGFPRDTIRAGFLNSEDFEYHLANTAEIARDADWRPLQDDAMIPDSSDSSSPSSSTDLCLAPDRVTDSLGEGAEQH
jgi:hypothetical protein